MAVAVVNITGIFQVSAATNWTTMTIPAVASGNRLVVGWGTDTDNVTVDVSTLVAGSNSLAVLAGPRLQQRVADGGNLARARCGWWTVDNITDGPTSVTAVMSASVAGWLCAYELSGVRASSPLDFDNFDASYRPGTPQTLSVVSDFADEIALGIFGNQSTGTYSDGGGGYTTSYDASSIGAVVFAHKIISSIGAQTWSSAHTANNGMSQAAITLRGLASAGATTAWLRA